MRKLSVLGNEVRPSAQGEAPSNPVGEVARFALVVLPAKGDQQGLTLVHLSAKPGPFLSLKPPNASHRKCVTLS